MSGVTPGLRALLGKLVCHKVDFEHEHYEGNDHSPAPLSHADVVSSVVAHAPGQTMIESLLGDDKHIVVVDIDHPAHLVESTTPGHHHLYVEIPPVSTEAYFRWLEASAEIGLIEPGYVSAFKARGFTCVRLPWVQKPGVATPPVPQSMEIPVEDLRF